MNFDKAFEQTVAYLKADIPVALWGSPGCGKSALALKVAEAFELEFIDIRLGQLDPVDLAGYPDKKEDSFGYLPYEEFPMEDTPLPPGKKGWLIMFDEINTAPRQNLNASYKILLDRKIGKKRLHPNVRMMTGGNFIGEGGLAGALPTPLVSRLSHITLIPELTPTLRTILGNEIYEFLRAHPNYIYLAPKVPNEPYPALRTWAMAHKYLNANPQQTEMEKVTGLAGLVSQDAALRFMTFARVQTQLTQHINGVEDFPLDMSQSLIDFLSHNPVQFRANLNRFKDEWFTIAKTKLEAVESVATFS